MLPAAPAGSSSADGLISPSVDAALRHLATFWTHRRHVVAFWSPQAVATRVSMEAAARNGSVMDPAALAGVAVPMPAALNVTHAISHEPLLVIIGLGVALLVADFAFGNLFCKRAPPTTAKQPDGLPSKAGSPTPTPGSSTPSTAEELQDAADEWEYFKRTKCKVLLLSMILGFASEFLLWMLAPFFPLEAAHRGVSTELIGLVFACHPIALGVSSQLAPWLMRNVRAALAARAAAAAPPPPAISA